MSASAVVVEPKLVGSEPILASADIAATLRFYCGVLGFQNPWTWGEPANHGGVRWGSVHVMFTLNPELAAKVEGHMHYFVTDEIDALHARHQAAKAPVVAPLETKPWGMREYVVRDPSGYRLRFAAPAISTRPAQKKSLPAGYRLVPRLPTLDENGALIHAVQWQPYTNFAAVPDALKQSLFAVVMEKDGVCVASGRLAGDGAVFVYVTDIMVHPSHQRLGLGTAVMDALMAWADQHVPAKAFVGLFTGRNLNGFYEQWGFRGADQGLWGMSKRIGVK